MGREDWDVPVEVGMLARSHHAALGVDQDAERTVDLDARVQAAAEKLCGCARILRLVWRQVGDQPRALQQRLVPKLFGHWQARDRQVAKRRVAIATCGVVGEEARRADPRVCI